MMLNMKTLWLLLAVSLTHVCLAQKPGLAKNALTEPIGYDYINGVVNDSLGRAWAATQFRLIEGKTNKLTDPGWSFLQGTVFQNAGGGMIVSVGGEHVFITQIPAVADGQPCSAWAKEVGLYQYSTVAGSTRTIRKFDCGLPVAAPATVVYREPIAQPLSDQEKSDLAKRVLKYQSEQADKGLPSFEYIMGKRYLIGDGVTQNVGTARSWFEKAAAQGDSDAKKALTDRATK
jgi:hypothetical protein